MSDLLASSPDTWRDRSLDAPVIPPGLVPDPAASWPDRLRGLRSRHLLREQRAKDVYEQSRAPERGWPVADNQAVFAFRRYEDASLRYTGIERHPGLSHYGLYDAVIAREGSPPYRAMCSLM